MYVVNCLAGVHVAHLCSHLFHTWATRTPPKQLTTKMSKKYTTKTINYKDGQHVNHQNI
jgi:hypothetical protein